MARPVTDFFDWELPEPDGDVGVWDDVLNAAFVDIDSDLHDVAVTAASALTAVSAIGFETGTLTDDITLDVSAVTPKAYIVNPGSAMIITLSGALGANLGREIVFYIDRGGAVFGTPQVTFAGVTKKLVPPAGLTVDSWSITGSGAFPTTTYYRYKVVRVHVFAGTIVASVEGYA